MSTLDNLKKEAKRFLKTLRESPKNPVLRQRLRLSSPNAPANPGLRDIQHVLARERGYDSWKALRTALAKRDANTAAAAPGTGVAAFLDFACWDRHTHGLGDYALNEAAAMYALAKEPGLARENLYTAIVCGDIDEMRRRLDADPSLVNAKGGPRRWEPLLYLCYARLPLPALRDNAIAMAQELMDRAPIQRLPHGRRLHLRHAGWCCRRRRTGRAAACATRCAVCAAARTRGRYRSTCRCSTTPSSTATCSGGWS